MGTIYRVYIFEKVLHICLKNKVLIIKHSKYRWVWWTHWPKTPLYRILAFFFLFRATPAAYGSSRARGPATATATQDLSHVFDLCCSFLQCQILNPLSKTRDWTRILMDTSWVLNPLSYNRNFSLFCYHLLPRILENIRSQKSFLLPWLKYWKLLIWTFYLHFNILC